MRYRGPVERVELVVASGQVERKYPFTLMRDGTGAARATPASASEPSRAGPAGTDRPAGPSVASAGAPAKRPVAVPASPARDAAPMKRATASMRPAEPSAAPAIVARAAPPQAAPSSASAPAAPPVAAAAVEAKPQPAGPASPQPVVMPAPGGPVLTVQYNDVLTAVLQRDHAGVAAALDAGMWVNRASANGVTPLMAAALNADARMVRLLLERGANVHRSGPYGSVADCARQGGSAEAVSLVSAAGAR